MYAIFTNKQPDKGKYDYSNTIINHLNGSVVTVLEKVIRDDLGGKEMYRTMLNGNEFYAFPEELEFV